MSFKYNISRAACVVSFSLMVFLLMNCGSKGERILIRDEANMLSVSEKDSIEAMIKRFEAETGPQISIQTLSTLSGVPIEEHSKQQFAQLNLGREKYQDGILITMVLLDRQMRIEVGKGLTEILPDEKCLQVITSVMVPLLSQEQYYQGIKSGIDDIKNTVNSNKSQLVEYKEAVE